MSIKVIFFLAIAGIAAISKPVYADIHKCTGANGATEYTDQPCAAAKGEKTVDTSVSGVAHQDGIDQGCNTLNDRRTRCGRIYPLLQSNFQQYCATPILRYQNELRQQKTNNRYVSAKERAQQAIANAQPKAIEDYRCDAIQTDMWRFLKENFGKKISDQDAKTIEYNIHAIPGDGKDALRLRDGMRD